MKKINLTLILTIMALFSTPLARAADLGPIPEKLPVPGIINVIDLGATKCIPCKMMAPILLELKKEYEGQAAIVFLDVREHPPWAKQFAIRSIPTQIFFDKNGREIFRHEGFFDKPGIAAKIEEIKAGQGQEKAALTVDDLPVKDEATLLLIDDSLKNKENFKNSLELLKKAQNVFPDNVFVVFVDSIKYPQILTKFKVETVPSLLFFDAAGKEIHRMDRVPALEQIVDRFQAAGVKPARTPAAPARVGPSLICLGDLNVTPLEKIKPLLDEVVTKYGDRLMVIYADRDKSPELTAKYKPEKYPVFIFINDQGLESHRQYGLMTLSEITDQLAKTGLK